MTCEGCPESGQTFGGVVLSIHTGGPASAQYANLALAIVNDPAVVRLHQPTVRPDGAIEYNTDNAPCPEGYEREANILKPVWPSCVYRILRCWQDDDGSLKIEARCMTSGLRGHEALSLDGCKACSVRQPIK